MQSEPIIKTFPSRKKSQMGGVQKKMVGIANAWYFTREFLRAPQAIGAVVAQLPFLARRMASLVPPGPGPVLGTGSGARHCDAPGKWHKASGTNLGGTLAAPSICAIVPGVEVLQGDAADLQTLLVRHDAVRAVVS